MKLEEIAASEIGRDIHVAASEVKLDANLGGKLVLHNLCVYRELYKIRIFFLNIFYSFL